MHNVHHHMFPQLRRAKQPHHRRWNMPGELRAIEKNIGRFLATRARIQPRGLRGRRGKKKREKKNKANVEQGMGGENLQSRAVQPIPSGYGVNEQVHGVGHSSPQGHQKSERSRSETFPRSSASAPAEPQQPSSSLTFAS